MCQVAVLDRALKILIMLDVVNWKRWVTRGHSEHAYAVVRLCEQTVEGISGASH